MSNDMTGPGTGGGVLSSLGDRMMGRASGSHAKVSKKSGPLDGLFLSQLIPALLLVLVGTITIWTASLTIADANFPRHLVGVALGLVVAVLIWRYDYRNLAGMTTVLFVITCFLMVMPKIPGLGVASHGMTGWVRLPLVPVRFQPVELGKVAAIFLMASASSQYNGKIERFSDYCRLCGTLLVPLALIVITDLGSGLVVLFLGATIIICSGAPRNWVLATIALIVGVSALVVITSMTDGLPHVLKDYQLKRLLVFADPSIDPSGDGYNLQQAKIAIGSGQFTGQGWTNGTMTQMQYVPENQTDYIFSVAGEELGFLGCLLIIILLMALIIRLFYVAYRASTPFSALIAVGVGGMLLFQTFMNIFMNVGLLPVMGLTLPFFSYGGTSIVTMFAALGIATGVRMREKPSWLQN